MKYTCIESEYLVALLKSALKSEPVPSVPKGLDWAKLVEMSKKQQVYSTIVPIINKINIPSEQAQELVFYSQNELVRMIAMKNELEEIEKELDNHGIKYMLLKGGVIRNYYPLQKMRQMSDFDLLYDYSKRDDLLKIMKKRGFRLTTSCENSDDFFKEPFYTFEWHRELFFEEAEFCPHFDLWKNATQDKDKKYKYNISSQDNFVYTVCHMYKHFATYGCGIRFLCDIYVLLNGCKDIDLEAAYESFKKIGIDAFAYDAVNLALACFDGGEISDNRQKMLDYMLSNGVYGNHIIDYSKRISQTGGSKLKYLFKRLFPSKKEMFANYRKLEKYPVLLPVYYIIRLCEKLKYNFGDMKAELKEIKKIK